MPRHSVVPVDAADVPLQRLVLPWTMAANAGTNVCLRAVDGCGDLPAGRRAPRHPLLRRPDRPQPAHRRPAELRATLDHELHAMIAGAPPPRALRGAERLGIDLTHVYGLTEVYGPATVCAKHAAWADLDVETRARRNGRQGVPLPARGQG
jgi:fatty-acyl-CoA synthase